jgi:tellurite resistance protein
MKAAKHDGIITLEELDIIEQVKVDADSYETFLKEAFIDGVITDEEAKKLQELKQMIIDRAELIAKIDGSFDADEQILIKKLSEIISQLYV